MPSQTKTRWIDSLSEISSEDWNRLADPENPFSDHEFLYSLELSSCVGSRTSWQPGYLLAEDEKGLHSALAFYHKYDSYGEYIFDHAWANFFSQNGLSYYPKGLIAYPFTPVNGRKIFRREDVSVDAALDVLLPVLLKESKRQGLSSIHFLFLEEEESKALEKRGFATRITHQFHWSNRSYESFEHFLGDFKSKKRMQIRREREAIRSDEIKILIKQGSEITEEDMDSIYSFYTDTYSRKWGSPYLNRKFFRLIREKFAEKIVLFLAEKHGERIAGTFNLRKGKKLYGRYWGSIGHFPFLHFECCYYSPIEYSIQNGLTIFEAGAQGEQKFLRGFPAVPTYSSHFIFHEGARNAIERFLENERMNMQEMILETNLHSPLKEQPGLKGSEL
ncbi:N-acetyltransferase [Leptospira langatensis]|uniref:N-acetyltransferase n=1 Tax=Leptospira langatensis TaxID=2484983 RepID=A0A5F1ZXF0_9LEPT|nr:GNAT family N-acetyltransferase [Leptospira langatensis]TGK04065.1 N-acetyltransferase [Leptospira langatensis]TGL43545.1 N-acetyltransferase [Leptospira langatensis]